MSESRTVEVFTAGCPLCSDVVDTVREMACQSCEVRVVSLQDESGTQRAREVGVQSVSAVAINGTLASCCRGQGVSRGTLREAGVGVPI